MEKQDSVELSPDLIGESFVKWGHEVGNTLVGSPYPRSECRGPTETQPTQPCLLRTVLLYREVESERWGVRFPSAQTRTPLRFVSFSKVVAFLLCVGDSKSIVVLVRVRRRIKPPSNKVEGRRDQSVSSVRVRLRHNPPPSHSLTFSPPTPRPRRRTTTWYPFTGGERLEPQE